MQDLVEGCVYEGVLQIGPFFGTKVLLKYIGESEYGEDAGKFQVLEDVEFGYDEEDPEDSGWWLEGQVVNLNKGSYKLTPYNPCLENK